MSPEQHEQTDRAALEGATPDFAAWESWLSELERIMRAWDDKHGNLPYSLPLTSGEHEGNRLCWMDSYDDGMTPQEAFDEDLTYWAD